MNLGTMLTGLAFGVAGVAAVRGLWSPCGLSMVSALNPMAERARGHRYWLTAAWYLIGAMAGGAVLGAGCAALAAAVSAIGPGPSARALLAAAAAAVCWLSDARVAGWHLPVHPRQVNERWIGRYRRWIYAAGFGLQIGTGLATYVMSATVYLAVVLAALTGNAGLALGVGLAFGATRGLGVLCGAAARTPQRLAAVLARLEAAGEPSVLVCVAVEVAVAVLAASRAAGPAGPVVAGCVVVSVGAVLVGVTTAAPLAGPRWKSDTVV